MYSGIINKYFRDGEFAVGMIEKWEKLVNVNICSGVPRPEVVGEGRCKTTCLSTVEVTSCDLG